MATIGNPYTKLARSAADICAFMVVCRHGQLSSAAREMKISQPSLSQRIRNLEEALDRVLFERSSKGVELTRDGQDLFRRLHDPLSQLAKQFNEVTETEKQSRLLLSVDFAFAYFWLLPRLPEIRQRLGQIDVCVLSTQEPTADAVENTDLVIQMGGAHQVSSKAALLMSEEVTAVCSPGFKSAHPELRTHFDLKDASQYLLHLNSPSSRAYWCTWVEWLHHWNNDLANLREDTVFNNYEMIIQAAVQGHGIALGWRGLVDELLKSGDLVELTSDTLRTDRGYYITHAKDNPSRAAQDLYNWIIAEASTGSAPMAEAI